MAAFPSRCSLGVAIGQLQILSDLQRIGWWDAVERDHIEPIDAIGARNRNTGFADAYTVKTTCRNLQSLPRFQHIRRGQRICLCDCRSTGACRGGDAEQRVSAFNNITLRLNLAGIAVNRCGAPAWRLGDNLTFRNDHWFRQRL